MGTFCTNIQNGDLPVLPMPFAVISFAFCILNIKIIETMCLVILGLYNYTNVFFYVNLIHIYLFVYVINHLGYCSQKIKVRM